MLSDIEGRISRRLIPHYEYSRTHRASRLQWNWNSQEEARLIKNLDVYPTTSQILTPETVFGDITGGGQSRV